MAKAINSLVGRTLRSVQLADKAGDEFAAECFRAASRWLNQAKAAQAQDDLGLARHCLRMATMQSRKAESHKRGELVFWG